MMKINVEVVSSFCCFFVSAAYAFFQDKMDLTLGSTLSLLTSVSTHYHHTQHKLLRQIDLVTVNSVALYFLYKLTFDDNYTNGYKKYIVYTCATTAVTLYGYQRFYRMTKHHWLIHVMANTGIIVYINLSTNL